ncbi:MAG: hypothetical protein KIT11_08080 [Fimbriimonadaceae bacterium]|nr:hypothetical protein [Fimbriimonadaceae bacterium]QYK56312.1 MAG: hypothetical protein KF733_02275 [Fimbriimonadaceae bacterium]
MALRILHTNDLHGKLVKARMPGLLSLRSEADVYFDSGDCVKSGNLAVPLRPEPVWGLLQEARCDASVIGNRETHVLEAVFAAKLAGAAHPVLCANLVRKDGSMPLPGHAIVERAGLRVGVVGVSVPMVTERMASRAASAFLWTPPLAALQGEIEGLRPKVDVLFVLSHLGYRADVGLATSLEGVDVIFGGHSHTVLAEPELHGKTAVCQGGSHARYIGRYQWEDGRLAGGLVEWPSKMITGTS